MKSINTQTIYLVNPFLIAIVKIGFLVGMPLLFSFLFSFLYSYRSISIGILMITAYLNGIYPDRIALSEHHISIKLFLKNDWIHYCKEQVFFRQGNHCVYIFIENKEIYRLSMHQFPQELYNRLKSEYNFM